MHYNVKVNEVTAHGANVYVSFRLIPVNPKDPANSSGATEDQVAQKGRAAAGLIQYDSSKLVEAFQAFVPEDVEETHLEKPMEATEASTPSTPDEQTESASPGTEESDAPVS